MQKLTDRLQEILTKLRNDAECDIENYTGSQTVYSIYCEDDFYIEVEFNYYVEYDDGRRFDEPSSITEFRQTGRYIKTALMYVIEDSGFDITDIIEGMTF